KTSQILNAFEFHGGVFSRSNPSERRIQAAPGRLLTRAIRALALRAPLTSKSAPGRFVFGYFLFDCMDAGGRATPGAVAEATHKFAGSEFEQPIGWPAGRKPGMVFVAKVSRPSVREPTSKSSRRASDTNKNRRLAALPARRMNVKNREQGVPLKPDVNLETSA
ncbi:hypothetical protein, partial [Methylomonas rivi]